MVRELGDAGAEGDLVVPGTDLDVHERGLDPLSTLPAVAESARARPTMNSSPPTRPQKSPARSSASILGEHRQGLVAVPWPHVSLMCLNRSRSIATSATG